MMSDVDVCKALERPGCDDWQRHNLAEEWWPEFVKRFQGGRHVAGDERLLGIERQTPSKSDFCKQYQGKRAMLVERAEEIDYSLDSLVADFPETKMRVSDTHGGMVEIGEWFRYAETTRDDSPFGLYDSAFEEFLILDYDKPEWARTCFLAALRCGVPLRWLLAGGARSGTGPHVDPLGTHAWLHLCQGSKLWFITPLAMNEDQIDLPSAEWWWARRESAAVDSVQFVQRPGELVYVPAGWTHCVLNLEATLAITENYYCDDIDELSSTLADAALERTITRTRALSQRVLLQNALLLERIVTFCHVQDAAKIAATSRAFLSVSPETAAASGKV